MQCCRPISCCCPLRCPQPDCSPLPRGCIHLQGLSCTLQGLSWFAAPAPVVQGLIAGWGQSKQLCSVYHTQYPPHPGPQQVRGGQENVSNLGREDKATSMAGLTLLEQEWVIMQWLLTAQAAQSRVRPQNPHGAGHRHHSHSHPAWAQTCRKCYCNIKN